jgi:hypothetical protein
MTAVRSVRSTAYGAKLFAYVLGVVAVGGVLLGLGYVLAWPTLADVVLGEAPLEKPATLAAGAVLGLLGTYVVGAGLLGAVHKLVADGVATGVERAELAAGGTSAGHATSAGQEGDSDGDPQPAEASVSDDRPESGSGSRPDTGPDPEAGPATGSGEEAAGMASPADGTGGAATTTADQAATPAADAEPGDAGPDGTGATEDDHQPAEPDAHVGPSAESEPGVMTRAAGDPDSGESGAVPPDPGATGGADTTATPDRGADDEGGPDRESDAGEGSDGADDAGAWTPPRDLETEPVDVETSDTVPVEAERGPDPGDVGVDDVGVADGPGGQSSDPREPSPEEIAFGSPDGDRGSDRDAGTDTGRDDRSVTEPEEWFEKGGGGESDAEPTETEGTGGSEPAGSTAPSDPLGDPNETE